MLVEQQIKSEILLKKKDMRLDTFLHYAMYNENGYYYKKKPIGKKEDFVTSPEISQLFGEIIGLYLYYIWKTKIRSKFNFIELGPGKGTLFRDIARSVASFPDFLNSAKISFVEINKELIKIQNINIKKEFSHDINWSKSINFKSNNPSIIYSNEFFDCFPIRQFIHKKSWFEKYVSFNKYENKLYFSDKKVINKQLLTILNLYKNSRLLEISFERNQYFKKICKFIKNKGGVFFTIDYGYTKDIKNFTLQAVQGHKFSNVLENIGEKDISSHVNFNDFISIANDNNLTIEEYSTQRDFLIKYGILERRKKLSNSKQMNIINSGLDRLINKKEMGNLFKCLVISKL